MDHYRLMNRTKRLSVKVLVQFWYLIVLFQIYPVNKFSTIPFFDEIVESLFRNITFFVRIVNVESFWLVHYSSTLHINQLQNMLC